MSGRVFQINTSPGGVPKLARLQTVVGALGLEGDLQRDMKSHGGPERALCLYPLENILALQAEGHPVFPGALGENLTVFGLEWSQLQPGTKLRIGQQVLVEVTRFTKPCNNLIPYFTSGDYSRVSQTKNPGWARVYARVLQTGIVRTGDRILIA